MSKFAKMAVIGGSYLVTMVVLLVSAVGQSQDPRFMRLGGGSVFMLYGLALLGLSVFAIAKEPSKPNS